MLIIQKLDDWLEKKTQKLHGQWKNEPKGKVERKSNLQADDLENGLNVLGKDEDLSHRWKWRGIGGRFSKQKTF